jgi:hypothetical protein
MNSKGRPFASFLKNDQSHKTDTINIEYWKHDVEIRRSQNANQTLFTSTYKAELPSQYISSLKTSLKPTNYLYTHTHTNMT